MQDPQGEGVTASPGPTPTAIVFGGSRGIGRATVLELASHGYSVGIVYHRNREAAEQTAKEAQARGAPTVAVARADAATWQEAKEAVDQLAARLGGRVNALVYSSGILQLEGILDLEPETWRRVIEVNLTGAYHATKATLPYMLNAEWAAIVMVASIAGQTGNIVAGPAYAASKAGLIGLTKRLAVELAPHGIRVNAVAPSFVETDMTRSLLQDPQQRRRIQRLHPLNIILKPEDVAKAIYFLIDPGQSRGITGHVLSINAGRYT